MRLNWAWPDKSSRTALLGPLKGSKKSEGRVERGKETFKPLPFLFQRHCISRFKGLLLTGI